MPSKSKPDRQQLERVSALEALGLRRNLVRILFVHRLQAEVKHCLLELEKSRFIVTSEVVETPKQFAEELGSKPFDLVVAEHPHPNWQETQALDILRDAKKDIPVIFLVNELKREAPRSSS